MQEVSDQKATVVPQSEHISTEERELLGKLKERITTSSSAQRIKNKPRSITELPPVWTEDSFLPIDWDVEGEGKAGIDQTFAEYRSNVHGEVRVTEIDNFLKEGIEVVRMEPNEETCEVRLKRALVIWTVVQPKDLYELQPNQWSTARWKPRVWNDASKRWTEASPLDCRNWKNIPEDKKRVNFANFIIPDD